MRCCKSRVFRVCVVLSLVLMLLQATGYTENSVPSIAESVREEIPGDQPDGENDQTLSLGNRRLFISGEQRSFLDKSQVIEPVTPEKSPPVKIQTQIKRQPSAAISVTPRTRILSLDGLVLRPDGSVDVWLNGSLIGERPNEGIKLLKAAASGPVVLSAYGQRYKLYPGQRQVVPLAKKVRP